MTRDEFDRTARPLLSADPFVPVVFTLADGGRLVIDSPEQVAQPPGGSLLVQPADGHRLVRYAEITEVQPLDRVGSGAISFADFQTCLRQLWREPARAFEVELTDGRRLPFPRGSAVALNGRFAAVVPSPGKPLFRFTAEEVARIVITPPVPAGH